MDKIDFYDWNICQDSLLKQPDHPIEFHDETLRDGIQSPSSKIPTISERIELVSLMDQLRIHSTCIGFPGASDKMKQESLAVAKTVTNQQLKIRLGCSARTMQQDIAPIADIAQSIGTSLEVFAFIGSSPIRQQVESWALADLIQHTKVAISFARKENLEVTYVTEDTTRSTPADLETLIFAAIESGASRICLCDTVGHATPNGVYNLVKYVRNILDAKGFTHIKIDFHGHMDRGIGIWNSLTAYMAGANRLHGCGLGIGERSGNTPMDLLLVNSRLMGYINYDLVTVSEYIQKISNYLGISIPSNYPVFGKDAFETATGVHAAAIFKAVKSQEVHLADLIYSSVPAAWFGQKQIIKIGPLSGKSNVIFWLESRNYVAVPELVTKILKQAKHSHRILEDDEILAMIDSF